MRKPAIVFCLIAGIVGCGLAHQQPPPKQKPPALQPADKSKAPAPTARKRVVTNLSGFDLLEPGNLRRQVTVVGATRSGATPVPLAPRLGKLYASHPTFSWSYSASASKFAFVLWNDEQQELFRAEVAREQFTYPASAPSLQPGRTYFWTVEASSPGFAADSSSPAGVLVVAGTQREEIGRRLAALGDSESYENVLARAQLFVDHRLWYDALAACSDLIARFPDRAEPYERRGMVYAQLPATRALAEQDFAHAEQLQRSRDPLGRGSKPQAR